MPNSFRKNIRDQKTNGKSTIANLDFCKACDRVDRGHTLRLIKHVGYPPNIYNMIDQIYRDTKSNILLKNLNGKDVDAERGLKQGCPMSTLLFILTLEPLLQILRDNKPLEVMQQAELSMKIIPYADDFSIIAADYEDIAEEIKIVNHFCKGTQF